MPHPLRFESKKRANLCRVSLEPRRACGNERNTSIFDWNFRKVTLPFTFHRNFRNFPSNGKHPKSTFSQLPACPETFLLRLAKDFVRLLESKVSQLVKHPEQLALISDK